ncbi:hypothetical protein CSA17_07285 [bacterium DOLJORAL78_65_58]|nr:MAG: hypothetical protein CSB20_14125 [bacterium DOLZORAL124_64_63]PIE75473.1 MAG: hypothetical protein CSA17_07285 [bacterium DOLJORAL78_65_58]
MRHFLHTVVSLFMWLLFGYYWYVVGKREIGRETLVPLAALGIVIVVGLVLTLGWVAYNKRLARRNRRRQAPPPKPEPFEKDNLGRPIEAPDVAVLRKAPIVEIGITRQGPDDDEKYGGIKVYTPIYRQGVR